MAFISRLINKRISNLISRFDVPKEHPQMVENFIIDNIQVKKKAMINN